MVSRINRYPLLASEEPRAVDPLRLLLLGTCQVEPLAGNGLAEAVTADLILWGARQHADVPQLDLAPYDAVVVGLTLRQIFHGAGHLLDPERSSRNCILWPRMVGEGREREYFDACAELVEQGVRRVAQALPGKPLFFASFFEPLHNFLGSLLPRYALSNPKFFVERLNERMAAVADGLPGVHFLDMNEIAGLIGAMRIQDSYIGHLAHASFLADEGRPDERHLPSAQPSTMYETGTARRDFCEIVFQRIRDSLEILRAPLRTKAIVVDLDNTLWRGVAAEEDKPPADFAEGWPLGLAEALLVYKVRGGMLAICSKNDAATAMARFDEIFHGRLRLDDFAAIRIDFERKSENVAAILGDLNILAEHTLFIDDNPLEIAEVRSRFPDMRFLGADHLDWRRKILMLPEMQVAAIDADAALRTPSVQARTAQGVALETMTRDEWLESLDMKVEITVVSDAGHPRFDRAFELINKTNQFNTTGRRWHRSEIETLLSNGGELVFATLKDRIADHGMIAVGVLNGAEIVQVVLSCRVFGNGVEYALGHSLAARVLAAHSRVTASIVDSGRNRTCHGYFAAMGFDETASGAFVRDAPVEPAAHIVVIAPELSAD